MKVFGGGQLLNADFGLKMVGKEMYRIDPMAIGTAPFSLLLSFGQAKERRVWLGDQQHHGGQKLKPTIKIFYLFIWKTCLPAGRLRRAGKSN